MNTVTFMTSLLTFYLKGEIRQEQHFIRLKRPNTILSFIPLGSKKDSIPIEQISSVSADFKLQFKNFLIGLLLSIIGIIMLLSMSVLSLIGLVVLIIGASNVINAFQTELTIDTPSGKSWVISFLIFEKGKAIQAAEQIEQLISRRYDATDVGLHTEKQTEALVNAISNIKNN